MTNIKTQESLLRTLEKASKHPPSKQEVREQRVSFIMAGVKANSGVTRDRIKEVLAAQDGRKAS